jgi:hypothetical protein
MCFCRVRNELLQQCFPLISSRVTTSELLTMIFGSLTKLWQHIPVAVTTMDNAQEGVQAFLRSSRAQLATYLLKRETFPVLFLSSTIIEIIDGAKIALCVYFVECELPAAVSLMSPPCGPKTARQSPSSVILQPDSASLLGLLL